MKTKLKVGDLVRHVGTKSVYVVIEAEPGEKIVRVASGESWAWCKASRLEVIGESR